MKAYKFLFLSAAALLFASCENDMEKVQLGTDGSFIAPVMNNVGNVIVNADNSDAETVVFSWTKADFGAPTQISYSLYVEYNGKSGLVGTTPSTMLAVSKGDLNGVLMNELGVAANETAAVTAYVTAKISGTDLYETIASNKTNTFNVTTFEAALKWYYCCGNFSGSWDIDNAPQIFETKGGSNTYSAMMDFNDGGAALSYFKITELRSWSGANWGFNYLTPGWGNLDPDQGDSNLSLDISKNTIWKITVKTTTMTIDAEPVGNTISLIGGYNDWGADDMFTYDYKTNSWVTDPIDFASDSDIKARLNKDWATSWGQTGKMSAAIAGGYELTTDNGGNIPVSAGTHTIRIYANRTPYVLVIE